MWLCEVWEGGHRSQYGHQQQGFLYWVPLKYKIDIIFIILITVYSFIEIWILVFETLAHSLLCGVITWAPTPALRVPAAGMMMNEKLICQPSLKLCSEMWKEKSNDGDKQ